MVLACYLKRERTIKVQIQIATLRYLLKSFYTYLCLKESGEMENAKAMVWKDLLMVYQFTLEISNVIDLMVRVCI